MLNQGKNNLQAQKLLNEARDYAYSPIVTEQKSKDKEFLALYRSTKRDAEKTRQTSRGKPATIPTLTQPAIPHARFR